MIRDVFLPTNIGPYYLFSQRIVACEVTTSHVRMVLVTAQGKTRTFKKSVEEAIENNNAIPYEERVIHALSNALKSIGSYDRFYSVLPASSVVFKELTVPFTSLKKIKLVLPFEVESLLPFPLVEATVDCIVTKQDEDQSIVYVAAVKNEVLAQHLALLSKGGVDPFKITVDLFELYALYKALYPQTNEQKNDVIFYLGYHGMRMAIVHDGMLIATRYVPHGLIKFAKLLDTNTEHLHRAGIDPEKILKTVTPFFADIKLTLDASKERLDGQPYSKLLLMGPAVAIKGLHQLLTTVTGISASNITPQTLMQHGLFNSKSLSKINNSSIIPLSAALSLSTTIDFNLNVGDTQERQDKRVRNQLIAAGTLLVLIIISVIGRGILTARKLRNEIKSSEQQAITSLRKVFPTLSKSSKSLEKLKRSAQNELKREKNIWFALSPQNRASFMKYLVDLSKRIDRVGLGLNLKKWILTENTMTFEGRVKNYQALSKLEEELRASKLFTNVPRLEELKFSLKMPLKPVEELS